MENMEVGKAEGGRIPILNWIKKVPGGLLLVPMVIVAIINTFCPNLVKIGGATEFLFTNTCTMYVAVSYTHLFLFFKARRQTDSSGGDPGIGSQIKTGYEADGRWKLH